MESTTRCVEGQTQSRAAGLCGSLLAGIDPRTDGLHKLFPSGCRSVRRDLSAQSRFRIYPFLVFLLARFLVGPPTLGAISSQQTVAFGPIVFLTASAYDVGIATDVDLAPDDIRRSTWVWFQTAQDAVTLGWFCVWLDYLVCEPEPGQETHAVLAGEAALRIEIFAFVAE